MSSPNEELLLEVLAEVAPGRRHGIVIGDALHNAGVLEIPTEGRAFRSFVEGPLRRALEDRLGEAMGAQVLGRLIADVTGATTDGTVPLGAKRGGKTPSEPRQRAAVKAAKKVASTLGYDAQAPVPVDVAIIGSDATTLELMRDLLGQRRYRLFAVEDVSRAVPLCEQFPVKVVMAMAEPHGFDQAAELRALLGDATPPIILLSRASPPPEPRGGVVEVLPKRIDESLVDSIEAAIATD